MNGQRFHQRKRSETNTEQCERILNRGGGGLTELLWYLVSEISVPYLYSSQEYLFLCNRSGLQYIIEAVGIGGLVARAPQ